MRRGILLCLIISCLSGCMDVATTGAQAVYNRQSLQKNFSDQYITLQIYRKLHFKTKEFDDTNISIATYNGDVLLAGQAPEAAQKTKAGEIAKDISGVKMLYNFITVGSPSSALTRISDSWLTTKVKARLIASDDLDASKIKVVSENGTVYLMGILPPDEANAAVSVARETDGVQSVVKIFSYMHISKKIQMVD